MVSPKGARVDMPIEGGYVGMVDRAEFDEFLRARAAQAGADANRGELQARMTREATARCSCITGRRARPMRASCTTRWSSARTGR